MPSKIVKFIEEASQPVIEPSSVKWPVRGMQQALMDRMSFCNKIIEAFVLDKTRHAAMKGC